MITQKQLQSKRQKQRTTNENSNKQWYRRTFSRLLYGLFGQQHGDCMQTTERTKTHVNQNQEHGGPGTDGRAAALSKQTKQHAQEKREKTNDATDEVVVITTTTTTTTTTKEHTATKERMAENTMHETGKSKS